MALLSGVDNYARHSNFENNYKHNEDLDCLSEVSEQEFINELQMKTADVI